MNREEKIKAIYEKIADKTLSFGCRVIMKDYFGEKKITLGYDVNYSTFKIIFTLDNESKFFNKNDIETIIGHPVLIGDCINYICNNGFSYEGNNKNIILLTDYWGNEGDLTKPLEMQSDKCIDYIFNLITKLK